MNGQNAKDSPRLDQLEQEMKKMRGSGTTAVDTALAQVRALADRTSTTNSSLIAALEVLSDQAAIHNHPDKEQFKMALKVVRAKEDMGVPLQGLVIKLVGTDAAKKVNASVDSWLKAQKKRPSSSEGASKNSKDKESDPSSSQGLANPLLIAQTVAQVQAAQQGAWRGRSRGSNRPRYSAARLCYICKSPEHLAAKCTAKQNSTQD